MAASYHKTMLISWQGAPLSAVKSGHSNLLPAIPGYFANNRVNNVFLAAEGLIRLVVLPVIILNLLLLGVR